jgi:hypothetical protein
MDTGLGKVDEKLDGVVIIDASGAILMANKVCRTPATEQQHCEPEHVPVTERGRACGGLNKRLEGPLASWGAPAAVTVRKRCQSQPLSATLHRRLCLTCATCVALASHWLS